MLSARHPRIRDGSRLLLLGDSLAVGLTAPMRALAEDEGVPFASVAREGSTISDFGGLRPTEQAARLQQALADFAPTLVLVSLGTNDEYLSEAALAAERDDLDALLEQLAPYEVAWVGVPELPKAASNGAVRMIRETGLPYFPSQRLDLQRGPDHLHPTVAGYAKWAGILWSWLT